MEVMLSLQFQDTFAAVPILSERFALSSTWQYHQVLPSLRDFVDYVQKKACSPGDSVCGQQVERLRKTSYVDMDFDAISQTLVINAFWKEAPSAEGWTERFSSKGDENAVEIGVLANEKATEAEELSFGGFLAVVGSGEKPSECSI